MKYITIEFLVYLVIEYGNVRSGSKSKITDNSKSCYTGTLRLGAKIQSPFFRGRFFFCFSLSVFGQVDIHTF